MLYDSLRTKLLALPDASLVYPAHGAGSLCGKALSKETFSTIGEQRRSNYALQPMSKTAFVELVTADQPDAPAYFNYDAVLNSKERPTLDETLAREVQPMTLDHVLALQSLGAQLLDVRDPAEFAAAHLAGSINIGLGGQYATWAGTVLSREKPIVIIADPGRENEAATRLGRIGFDQVVGYLQDGLHSLDSATRADERPPSASARRLAAARVATPARAAAPLTVDVRAPARARAEAHRRQRRHAAQSSWRAPVGAAGRSPAPRLLRRRLSLVDCRQPPAAPWLHDRSARLPAASPPGKRRSCQSSPAPAADGPSRTATAGSSQVTPT